MEKTAQLTNGECVVVTGETNDGIEFDGGLLPWSLVAGWWCWNAPTSQMMFVPVN